MTVKPQVFVVTKPDHNMREAEHWGELCVINNSYIFGDAVHDNQLPPEFLEKLRAAALEFTPQFDYLAIAGDHLQMLVFSSYLARLYKYYRVLRYDRKAIGYWEATIYPGAPAM